MCRKRFWLIKKYIVLCASQPWFVKRVSSRTEPITTFSPMSTSKRYISASLFMLVINLKTYDAFNIQPTTVHNPLKRADIVFSPQTTTRFVGDAGTESTDVPSSESTNGSVSEESYESTQVTSAASDMDILNSPQFLSRKRDVLMNDIQKIQNDITLAREQLQQNKNEWGSQFADLQKEYEMIQQRMNVQSNASNDAATLQVVRSMLAVLDNFDRAFGQVTVNTEDERAIENEYKQVYFSILDIFKKLGVEEVPTVGIEFNYEIHQAVMQKPSTDYSEGIVCEELQKGFQINNTLIRAAMVAVAM
jgi:molecular chaperone GrpE